MVDVRLAKHIFKLGEVGVKEPDAAGGFLQPLLGEFQISRIRVQPDQQSVGAKFGCQCCCVAGATDGAVDECLARDRRKMRKNLVEQNRIMARFGQLHGRKVIGFRLLSPPMWGIIPAAFGNCLPDRAVSAQSGVNDWAGGGVRVVQVSSSE